MLSEGGVNPCPAVYDMEDIIPYIVMKSALFVVSISEVGGDG